MSSSPEKTAATPTPSAGSAEPPLAQPSRHIRRLSLLYSPYHDRLEIRAIDNHDRTISLWLTQRLCTLLVRAVIGVLEKSVGVEPETTNQVTNPQSRQQGQSSEAQFMEQTRAELAKQPAAAVQAPHGKADFEEVLVDGLRLRQFRQTYALNLSWGDEAIALPMTLDELRQLMRALHNRYRAAEWSMSGLWPDWFSETAHQTYVKSNLVN